jgi:hypothetical protein
VRSSSRQCHSCMHRHQQAQYLAFHWCGSCVYVYQQVHNHMRAAATNAPSVTVSPRQKPQTQPDGSLVWADERDECDDTVVRKQLAHLPNAADVLLAVACRKQQRRRTCVTFDTDVASVWLAAHVQTHGTSRTSQNSQQLLSCRTCAEAQVLVEAVHSQLLQLIERAHASPRYACNTV